MKETFNVICSQCGYYLTSTQCKNCYQQYKINSFNPCSVCFSPMFCINNCLICSDPYCPSYDVEEYPHNYLIIYNKQASDVKIFVLALVLPKFTYTLFLSPINTSPVMRNFYEKLKERIKNERMC